VLFALAVNGGKLTGYVFAQGAEHNIQNGTYSAAILEFSTTEPDGNGGQTTLLWSGTFKGDEIAFSRIGEDRQGQALDIVATRQD
jgi:hypothetical protein